MLELLEEDVAQQRVVVLAGVDERPLERHLSAPGSAIPLLGGRNDGCDLDEVGSRADDIQDLRRQQRSSGLAQ